MSQKPLYFDTVREAVVIGPVVTYAAAVPTQVDSATTFVVAALTQVVYGECIIVDGVIQIDGTLVGV